MTRGSSSRLRSVSRKTNKDCAAHIFALPVLAPRPEPAHQNSEMCHGTSDDSRGGPAGRRRRQVAGGCSAPADSRFECDRARFPHCCWGGLIRGAVRGGLFCCIRLRSAWAAAQLPIPAPLPAPAAALLAAAARSRSPNCSLGEPCSSHPQLPYCERWLREGILQLREPLRVGVHGGTAEDFH